MRSIPPRHRAAVARRIAAGLPLWAAAKGSAIAAEDVSSLMGEDSFRELIAAWTDIFGLDDEARERRLLTLASMILEDRLARDCERTARFVQRQYARRHGPREALAKGFAQLVDMVDTVRIGASGRVAAVDGRAARQRHEKARLWIGHLELRIEQRRPRARLLPRRNEDPWRREDRHAAGLHGFP